MSTVVIGAGLAGLSAAIRLAQAGEKVTLLTFGLGGLQLGQGTVDVLGYGADGRLVEHPFDELARADLPTDHPYRRVFPDQVRDAVDWFASLVPGLLVPGNGRNRLVPTALGAMRPTYLVQPSFAWPDAASVAVVGPRQIKDFYPELVAANLEKTAGVRAWGHHVDVPARPGAECPPTVYATALDDPKFMTGFAQAIRAQIKDADAVVVPAVIGLKRLDAPTRLAEAIGRPVVEAILPPPSIPGMRLNQALTQLATSLGVRLILGSKVIGFNADGDRVTSVTLHQAGRDEKYAADHFVYAPGGFESGALAVDSYGHVTETLFGLPLAGLGDDLITPGDSADQRLFTVGVSVDARRNPCAPQSEPAQDGDDEPEPIYRNLHPVGGVLGGTLPWTELSGDGIAIATAVRAADIIIVASKKGVDHG